MRFLSTLLFVLLTPLAFAGTHRTHIVNTDDHTKFEFVKDSNGETWAAFTSDGIRYITTDADVLTALDKAMEKHRALSREHSHLGRKHSELGREHSALGREHSRLGREHSRLGREASRYGDSADLESQQRELEAEQRKLEAKQQKLEDRQRVLEDEQRELEAKSRIAEADANRAIRQIFDRAIREGKARRD